MAASLSPRPLIVRAPVRLHLGRLAMLVLLIVGASLYVSPLRAFFTQQDRYMREVAVLEQARADNTGLRAEVARMRTRAFVTRQARDEYQLAPAGLQAFVVKGLPEADATHETKETPPPMAGPSLVERLRDLWRTVGR